MSITFNEKAEERSNVPLNEPSRPMLSDFIGQPDAITCLQTYCSAAKANNAALDHVLLTGKHGLGKTLLAFSIANEMGRNMRITSGVALGSPGDLVSILTNLSEGDILFIDDIHRLNPKFEEILYPALEEFAIDIVLGKGPSANSIRLDLPHFTLIGASYKSDCISDALKSRFGIRIELKDYSADELCRIVERQASSWQLPIDHESAHLIGEAAGGSPREALVVLRRMRDFAQVNQESGIREELTRRVLDLLDRTCDKNTNSDS